MGIQAQSVPTPVLIDGSRLIVESLAQAGSDIFIGYPITPANLLYLYSSRRFPKALSAPDEITTLQWMSGCAAAGAIPTTATSFPGYALMIESINMAVMMELPMIIVLAQRLGPATGTATCGAQGDLFVVHGTLSGGYSIPTLCISSFQDCWELPAKAVELAVQLRTPVVILTSKEMAMTTRSFDLASLPPLKKVSRDHYSGSETYRPYDAGADLVPPFLPVGNNRHQVRLTASTHDRDGIIQTTGGEALKNTRRLQEKVSRHLPSFSYFDLSEDAEAETLIVSYDVTALAACEATTALRAQGRKVSLLVAKTLLPLPPIYREIMDRYRHVVIAEENLSGQLRALLYGAAPPAHIRSVTALGRMITPEEIIAEAGA